jgi:tetratricopeptide (TPR) repeat protein
VEAKALAQANVGPHVEVNVGSYVNPTAHLDELYMDTLTLARNIAYQKDFETADKLLTQYNNDHTDLNALRLHAQVLYWMKAFDRSTALYEKAMTIFPNPSGLHLDYARVSFNLGKLSKAKSLLSIYRQVDSTNVEADIMNAYLKLWTGKLASANKRADKILQQYPTNVEANDIKKTIGMWTVPYVKAGTQFFSDDQPVKGSTYYIEGGVYKSWLFAPTVQAAMYHFKTNDSSFHSTWLQLSNAVQLTPTTKLNLKGGYFQQNGNESALTGSAEISQTFAHHFSLNALIGHQPYQYNIASMRMLVMEDVSGVGLSYSRNNKWYGKLGYDTYEYGDENKVHVAYFWMLAPVISTSHISFSAGYAFRYADALNTTYTSKQSMQDVINNWPPVNGIPGFYNPYFTPEGQVAHSALASLKISPSKKIHFTSTLNYAFSAKADNPYLFVDSHDNGLYFNHGFAQVNYTPIAWVNELNITASKRLSFAANYVYNKLLYYTIRQGSIELKYVFVK